jgi:hypothetical protein
MKTFELIRGFEIDGKKIETKDLENNGIYSINRIPYDYVSDFIRKHAIIMNGDYTGAINDRGQEIIPCKWEDVELPYNDYFIVKSGLTKLYTYIGLDGKKLNGDFFEAAYPITDNLGLVKNGVYNYIKVPSGEYLDEYGYEKALPFTEGLGAVLDYETNLWGFINTDNNFVIKPRYTKVRPFCDGMAAVMNDDNMWGYIDKTGHQVISFMYDEAYSFSGGSAVVTIQGRSCIIDKKNQVSAVFEEEDLFKDSKDFILENDNKYSWPIEDEMYFLDYKEESDDIDFEEYPIKFDDEDKFGLLDEDDYEISPPIYDEIGDFYDGYAKMKIDGKAGHIDFEGVPLIRGISIATDNISGIKTYSHIKTYKDNISFVTSKHIYGIKIIGDDLNYCKWFDNIKERNKYIEKHKTYINVDNCVITKQLRN